MSTPRPGYSAISSFSRVRILALVQQRPDRTIAELTTATGLHANTVREHLQRLVDEGFVIQRTEHRTTRGRPRTLYSAATGTGDASSPIVRRKVREAAARGDLLRRVMPETADDAAELGKAATHQLDAIVEYFENSGFEPVIDADELTIDLSPCPHALAQAEHRETLCAVHLGLMRTVLAEADGPLQAACVRTSAQPEECVVQLARMRADTTTAV